MAETADNTMFVESFSSPNPPLAAFTNTENVRRNGKKRKGSATMVNNFNWVEIRTRDLERARRFYEALFGWKISGKENKDFAYWHINTGVKPSGGMWQMPEDKPLGIFVYILVDDIETTLKSVEELGGKVTVHKSPAVGECFMAFFADPDGNIFGLWEEHRK